MTTTQLADPALETPFINTNPLPEYGYDRIDFGMVIGIEQTRGDRMWACWVGGGDSEKGFFVLASSDDAGRTWSDPQVVIDPHDESLPHARRSLVGNLWLDPRGRLWLFFDQAMGYFDGRAGLWATRCDDPDAAETVWTEPVRIWHGCSLNKPTVLSTGEWMINVSLWNRERIAVPFKESFPELDVYRMANQLVSIDEGETWTRRGGVRFPKPAFDEAHIVERRDGSLWITSRSDEGLYESVSTDRGRTWSEPCKSSIGHLPSRHHLRRLKSGRLLLVKHGLTVDEVITVRSHLCAFLSEDEGRTWKGGLLIDVREHVSYPDGFQSADGSICIIYDFHRGLHGDILFARFREEDILAGNWVTADSVRMRFIATGFPPAIARRRQIEGSEA